MPDREKVKKGLDICTSKEPCNGCPYLKERNCSLAMVADALALLKEQEAQKFLVDESGKITPLPVVVRCKDCIYAESFFEKYKCYFDEENESGCKRSHDADFFCAYGERKET